MKNGISYSIVAISFAITLSTVIYTTGKLHMSLEGYASSGIDPEVFDVVSEKILSGEFSPEYVVKLNNVHKLQAISMAEAQTSIGKLPLLARYMILLSILFQGVGVGVAFYLYKP